MAINPACSEGVLCKLTECATFLYDHPLILALVLIVALLAALGLAAVYQYYREHGARETAMKGSQVFVQAGYTAYSALKHLKSSSATGAIVASILTLVGGVPHIYHLLQGSHARPAASDHSGAAAPQPVGSRQLVPVAVQPVAPVAPAASPVDHAAMADIAVKVAQHYPDRKVEVRISDLVITIHPRGEQGEVRQT